MQVKIAKTSDKEELREAIDTGRVVVWDSDEDLHKVLEDIYDDIPDKQKPLIKVCKNVSYSKPVSFYDSGKEKGKFKTIYDFLNFYYRNIHNFKRPYLVINSNSKQELFDTIQQFIYLKINMDIYTQEELKKRRVVEKFKSSYKDLEELVQQVKESLYQKDKVYNSEEVMHLKQKIINYLENIKDELKKVETDIKVAVFSTKKSGKSMVVNGLIGEEIAPTSIELPTPNNILYIPYEEDTIKLKYKGQEKIFESHIECRDYIKKEFKLVKEKGEKLDDMEIYYPYKKYKQKKYRIYDTPGPDLASKDETKSHKEVYKKVLVDTDVAIFIIDYTKYAQESEVELFKDIKKEFFDKSARNMSFICVANKIDQVFGDAGVEKLTIRIADFIVHKFKELGFDNFIVIPISARTYFYIEKIAEKFPDIRESDNLRERLLAEDIENYTDGVTEEYISEIQNFTNNLRRSFKNENLRYQDIIDFTYFDYFEKYIDYIAQSKAEVEKIYGSIIPNIDSKITAIKNEINGRINLLQKDIRKITEELSKFLAEVEPISAEKEKVYESLEDAEYEIYKRLRKVIKDNLENIYTNKKTRLKEELNSLRELLPEYISGLKKGFISKEQFIEKYSYLKMDFGADVRIDKLSLSEIERNIKGKLKEPQDYINNTTKQLEYSIDRLNHSLQNIIGRHIGSSSFVFYTPDFNVSISPEVVVSKIQKLLDGIMFKYEYELQSDIVIDNKDKDRNFIENLKNRILDIFLRLTGAKWEKIEYHIKLELLNIEKELLEEFEREYRLMENKADELLEEFKKELNEDFLNIKLGVEEYFIAVKDVISGIKEDLSKDIDVRGKIVEFSKMVDVSTRSIYKYWEEIKNVN